MTIKHTAGGTRYDQHGEARRVNMWETIDHRWILRDAVTAEVPPDCPPAFQFRVDAEAHAQIRGWEVSAHPS